MNNQQFHEVENLIQKSPLKLNQCPTCQSKAIKISPEHYEWPKSSFRLFGKDYLCDCQTQIDLYRHYLLANIPDKYMRFNDKDWIGHISAWDETLDYLQNWNNYKINGIGISYFSEKLGTGKTFLATYVGRDLIKKGESVYYIDFRDIIPLFYEPYEIRNQIENRLKYDTVLILDEIGKPISDAQKDLFAEKLESLIRYRTNYGRITILTTNLEPNQLNSEYSRVFSLLSASQIGIKVETSIDTRKDLGEINYHFARSGEIRPIS